MASVESKSYFCTLKMATIGTDIARCISLLQDDEVVGIPTETVYGLAGNALSEQAVLRIFETKQRPRFDPLIAHIPDVDHLDILSFDVNDKLRTLTEAFWPGPLTVLLPKRDEVPDLLTSGLDRVAVRVPDHKLTQSLLASLEFPLAAPSANPFGYVSPTKPEHVAAQLGHQIPYILDGGDCTVGIESTIVGEEDGRIVIYRLGGLAIDEIEGVVGKVKVQVNESSNPKAPGMLKSHYSPSNRLLIGNIRTLIKSFDPEKVGIISFKDDYGMDEERSFVLSGSGDLKEAAQNLFAALRLLDRQDVEVILTEYVPEEGLGFAINDRLKRASV